MGEYFFASGMSSDLEVVEVGAQQSGDHGAGKKVCVLEDPCRAVGDGERGRFGVRFEEAGVGRADEAVFGPVGGRRTPGVARDVEGVGFAVEGVLGGVAVVDLFAVGPEGGFSDAELEMAVAAGWRPVALGPRTLRVDTAAIALAVLLAAKF